MMNPFEVHYDIRVKRYSFNNYADTEYCLNAYNEYLQRVLTTQELPFDVATEVGEKHSLELTEQFKKAKLTNDRVKSQFKNIC